MLGRLIRDVEPDLMDGLIQASKDGDMSKFESLYTSEIGSSEDDVEEESGSDDDLEVSHRYPLSEQGLNCCKFSILSLNGSNDWNIIMLLKKLDSNFNATLNRKAKNEKLKERKW